MSKRYFVFTLFLICLGINSMAQELQPVFKPGEKLKYFIRYGVIRGGRASLCVKTARINNKPVLHLILTGKTVGLAHTLYRVKDTYESFVDPQTYLPIKAIRNIREGRYRKYNIIKFDQEKHTAHSKLTGLHSVPENIQDILSAFYYARQFLFTPNMKPDEMVLINTFFSDELFPLRIRFKGYDTIRTKLGKIRCYKFVPVVLTGRVFKNKDDMTIWVSADKNRLPVRVKFNLFIGSLYCDLVNYSGLTSEFKTPDIPEVSSKP